MRRIMAGAVGLLLASTVLVGCTGDEETPESDGGSSSSSTTRAPVETSASVGAVAGRLGKQQRRQFLRAATATVDEWLDAAYVAGDYPRSDFGKAFPGFTQGAATLARKQPKVMSNAAVGDRVEQVTVKQRKVTVDVLAPGGKPAGATARVVLVVQLDGDVERKDRISGRLMLTPKGKQWKVFGFDMTRNVKGNGK